MLSHKDADSKQDFICPITSEVFYKPVETECKHVFEKEALQEWLEDNHTSCPLCRKNINGISCCKDAQAIVAKMKKNPALAEDLYFSELMITEIIHENKKFDITRLQILLQTKTHILNQVPTDEDKSRCVVYRLARFQAGKAILGEKSIRDAISVQALNFIDKVDQMSALAWLVLTDEGLTWLKEKEFRDKITAAALNFWPAKVKKTKDPHCKVESYEPDISPLFDLVSFPAGRELLRNDAQLRSKVQQDALNHPVHKTSAFELLLKHDKELLMTPELAPKLTEENSKKLLMQLSSTQRIKFIENKKTLKPSIFKSQLPNSINTHKNKLPKII